MPSDLLHYSRYPDVHSHIHNHLDCYFLPGKLHQDPSPSDDNTRDDNLHYCLPSHLSSQSRDLNLYLNLSNHLHDHHLPWRLYYDPSSVYPSDNHTRDYILYHGMPCHLRGQPRNFNLYLRLPVDIHHCLLRWRLH